MFTSDCHFFLALVPKPDACCLITSIAIPCPAACPAGARVSRRGEQAPGAATDPPPHLTALRETRFSIKINESPLLFDFKSDARPRVRCIEYPPPHPPPPHAHNPALSSSLIKWRRSSACRPSCSARSSRAASRASRNATACRSVFIHHTPRGLRVSPGARERSLHAWGSRTHIYCL